MGRSTLESIGSPHTGQHTTTAVDGTPLLRGRVVEATALLVASSSRCRI